MLQTHTFRNVAAVLAATMLVGFGAPQVASAQQDPSLLQTVTGDEAIVPSGETVDISTGHMDIGPMQLEDFELRVRDDAAAPPVWRDLDDVVFVLGESSTQVLPDTNDYDFTGAQSGDTVWVIPQTQEIGVPWLGWNTQSPSLDALDLQGVTLQFDGHDGPGRFTMFLQSGGFGPPEQLWNSDEPTPQAVWVEINNHTHANWVFTEPGVHLVKVSARAQLPDGTEQVATKVLRFAVGDDAATKAAAHTATFDQAAAEVAPRSESRFFVAAAVIAVVGVAALIAVLLLVRRGTGVQSRRKDDRQATGSEQPSDTSHKPQEQQEW